MDSTTTSTINEPAPALARRLGLFDATMIVMGGIIGVGIFMNPSVVARHVNTIPLILGVWLLGGLIALVAAFIWAELAALRPQVGGQYAYLREAYHPLVAFLYGWGLLLVIQSGGMAAVAVTFGRYFIELTNAPLRAWQIAVLALTLLTLVNCFGVRAGSMVQSALMILKILAIVALIACGFFVAGRHTPSETVNPLPPVSFELITIIGAAMVPVLFAYGGWQTSTFVAVKFREPTKNLPRALIIGVTGVVILYLAVTLVCVLVLGPVGLAKTTTPASDVMRLAFGAAGGRAIAAGIAISTFGFLSQSMLTAPRVYFAMAEDGLFFRSVAKLSPKSQVPILAIALQGVLAIAIAIWVDYDQILSYVVSVDFIFFGATAACIFVFRHRNRATVRARGRGEHSSRAGSPDNHCDLRCRVLAGGNKHCLQLPAKNLDWFGVSTSRNSRLLFLAMEKHEMNAVQEKTRVRGSEYIHWARTRSRARFNLATSGLANVMLEELQVSLDELEITGEGEYGYPPLRTALAEWFAVDVASVVTAAGTSFANHLALAALINPGDEVLIESPAYDPLLAVAHYLGAEVKRFERRFEDGFRVSPAEIERNISTRTKLIVLTNFHNPSGVQIDEQTLREIGELARKRGARVLVDEVYLQMLFAEPPPSAFHLGNQFVVTSSLTKAFGLSGLRCGWILAEPELAKRMWLLNDIFAATPVHAGERLSVVALKQLPAIATRAQSQLDQHRQLLNQFLDGRDDLETVRPPFGAIMFPRVRGASSEPLCDLLREEYETSVVPGRFFEMPAHFRIGMGGDSETFSAGLERLGSALDELRN